MSQVAQLLISGTFGHHEASRFNDNSFSYETKYPKIPQIGQLCMTQFERLDTL